MKRHELSNRRNKILELLQKHGAVNVSQLVDMFHVSEVTIRADLTRMDNSGLLRRVHGGAVSLGSKKAYNEMVHNDRMDINKEEKIRIAKACAIYIKEGDTLMLDSGTTNRYVARELSERVNLTVVTNSIFIAQELGFKQIVNVILLGGHLDTQYQFTYGADAVSQLEKYRASKMILSTDGIGVMYGLTTYHSKELDVSRLMIARSAKVIVAADYSKIGVEGFSNITDISNVDVIVTNKSENKKELDNIKALGIIVEEV